VIFHNTTASANSSVRVALRQDADSTILTVPDQILEFGGCVTESLEGKGIYGQQKELSLDIDVARLQGQNIQAITADSNLRGTASASPSEVTYLHVMAWDNVYGATSTVVAEVVLEYEAIFYEPRNLVESLNSADPFAQRLFGESPCKVCRNHCKASKRR
jgi:hypothetical protein